MKLHSLFVLLLLPTGVLAQDAPLDKPPTIEFLSLQQGKSVIVGAEDDDFFSRLHPREVAAMTGSPRGEKTKEKSQEFAREFFRKAVLEFDDHEQQALQLVVERVTKLFGAEYPLLVHRPWKFIKTRRDLCGGFSFTRDDCIVLSESTLANITKMVNAQPAATQKAESLLLHEQMHCLQRAEPELFQSLYERLFHFQAANVNIHPWIDERQVTNPDGVSDDWVAVVPRADGDPQTYWIGTILQGDKNLHQMGRDFTSVAVELQQSDGSEYFMMVDDSEKPVIVQLDELNAFTDRLPVRGGYEHPNEVAAYLFTAITHGEGNAPAKVRATEVLTKATTWFKENLKPDLAQEKSE